MTKKKPAKNQKSAPKAAVSGVKKSELSAIRKMLLAKRTELEQLMRKNQEMEPVSQEVGDEADQAGQSLEKELIFEVSDNERLALDQIEGALRKMDKGTYGLCESCQKPIPKIRLKAVPFARYCIGCQTSAERAVLT
ncbi:MAG: TraR/DksA family transcriptional regulator [Elusimicrobiota bacterium]